MTIFQVIVDETGLDDAGTQIETMRHDGCPEDTASLVETMEMS